MTLVRKLRTSATNDLNNYLRMDDMCFNEDLKFSAVISPQALGRIIPDTCQCIYKALKKKYLKFPDTVEEWQKIARDYNSRWNFPNCGGAIDGKQARQQWIVLL
ncbi:unnamed protein product [Acanthoscelides obtectus]|uniref:Uncharacterized protein n=1 Tax=Acanthoscelides obtectus TaxID=200917 RepID=A0A9P0JQA2_ACAOB|nr:unnamed protein product [Acanthoscelides obtectus]CAK1672342.1 hypothetical protein AOBTE_LOCUS28806 [Acanthoscelides obtectus]